MIIILVGVLVLGLFIIGIPTILSGVTFINRFKDFNNIFVDDSGSHGLVTKLKWKTIKDLYYINKSRWRYEEIVNQNSERRSNVFCLLYNTGDDWTKDTIKHHKVYPYKNKKKIIRIQLSFIDYIKFCLARKFVREKDLGTELILKSAQADIAKVKEEALAKIEEGQKMMMDLIDQHNKAKEGKNDFFPFKESR